VITLYLVMPVSSCKKYALVWYENFDEGPRQRNLRTRHQACIYGSTVSIPMIQVDYLALLPRVIETVERAGELLRAEWFRFSGPRGHGDKADIDLEIEEALRPELLALLNCDFWGEETGHSLSGHPWCWVVDPNDGTKDFLQGLKGSSIAVGLLHHNLPVLGVVHAPVTSAGLSDCIAWAEGLSYLIRNGNAITVNLPDASFTNQSVILVSAAAVKKPAINTELCAPASFCAMPSIAYRLAKVAVGDALCGISLFPVSAHDVVAAHALLRGAKGVLINENGVEITYENEDKKLNVSKRCFGGGPSACRELAQRDWGRIFFETK
jgi:fructose-1,6-bisphosphatase/inositol monophosphatase family enzyme